MSRIARAWRLALLLGAMLLATFALGWSGVLFTAIAFAFLDRRPEVPVETAVSAASAWALLFLIHVVPSGTAAGPSMIVTVAHAMGISALVPPLVTIAFPALLAWSGATVGIAILHLAGRPRRLEQSAPAAVAD